MGRINTTTTSQTILFGGINYGQKKDYAKCRGPGY